MVTSVGLTSFCNAVMLALEYETRKPIYFDISTNVVGIAGLRSLRSFGRDDSSV